MNRTSYSPSCPAAGVQLNAADVFEPFGVNVAPKGRPETSRDAMGSPSGSLALTVKLKLVPVTTSSRAGAVTTGAWFWPAALTVMSKVLVVETPPAVAVTAAVKFPTLEAVGVRVSVVATTPVPVVGLWSIAKPGRDAVSAIERPSASTATTFTDRDVPALRLMLGIGDSAGA